IKSAIEEGVQIKDCTQVIGFKGQDGRLKAIECLPTLQGEPDGGGIPKPVIDRQNPPMGLPFDRAFIAIGQQGTLTGDDVDQEIAINGKGLFEVDEFFRTPIKGIYATGDAVSGPASVVDAMAMGKNAASIVHQDLSGKRLRAPETLRPEDRDFPEIATDIPFQSRPMMSERQPGVRTTNFCEVELGLNQPQVLMETERCLQCGICSECLECVDVCQAIGAINHRQQPEEIIEHAGALIIADPDIIPNVKGEDIIRAYGPRTSTQDVYSMMIRGFAAAAGAMALLGQTTHRPKGHGISFSPPDPGLSPEIRIGVFVCRCNDSMGWLDGMSEYIGNLTSMKDVIHAEELPAACTPEGSTQILRTVREKGITRLVLASCVCCPLNFVCSACTDQRSRLKHFLFDGTGISRSMVETCNLRGEVLSLIKNNPLIAMKRFSGFIERSIRRSKTLKALATPARNYNFTTAVIGGSESSVNSVLSLAKIGIEVFWFTLPGKPVLEELERPNIHVFDKSAVKSMSGVLGNFQIHMESGDFHQTFQVGAVILGEKSRKAIPFRQAAGLPVQIKVSYQKKGVPDIPFFYPGATSIPGLFLSDPPGVNVSKRKKGAAAAILAAAVMPRGPRQNKGFTVVIDKTLCRGCGRCLRACPYKAVSLNRNAIGGWCASVDEALCKGCGNCISVCPSNAADSPYRSQKMLEQTLQELLGKNTTDADDMMFNAIS
ncbi:MAG: 4Fe-4S binding protein, partial [Desulfobacterales bacterium]|nr:4Fe-4S binding protein [Desulfobacterales bacterium]